MVRAGEPPPKGCGSSMTRTSTPLFGASSRARITLRSVKRYSSIQTDFFAALIASVIGCSPASGSTKTWTPCTPGPVVQFPVHDVVDDVLLDSGRLTEHPASTIQSAIMVRYFQDETPLIMRKDVEYIAFPHQIYKELRVVYCKERV